MAADTHATQAWVEQIVVSRVIAMQTSMSAALRIEFDLRASTMQEQVSTSLDQL